MLNRENIGDILIGADPELFVQKGRHFVSGHLFPCGTKEQPMATANGALQNDGLALEFNIKPAASQSEFVENMNAALKDLNEFLKSKDPNAKAVARPSIFFGVSKLKELPPYVYDLGCTPDYNAYYRHGTEPTPKPDFRTPFRTGAGHIHIGWGRDMNYGEKEYQMHCASLVEYLDCFVALPSLLWDKDKRRRSLYGAAGSFRPKPYGLEYRVLSNAWVGNDKLTKYVYQQTMKACIAFVQTWALPLQKELTRRIVNDSDASWVTNPRYERVVRIINK
jgi:hypothetical protein